MQTAKRKKLEAKGWRIGSAEEFLGLTSEEVEYIEMKLALSQNLRELRVRQRLTQIQLANLIDSSQSRVAKMETGDPSVSIDLLIKSLIALGATKKEIARKIASSKS